MFSKPHFDLAYIETNWEIMKENVLYSLRFKQDAIKISL